MAIVFRLEVTVGQIGSEIVEHDHIAPVVVFPDVRLFHVEPEEEQDRRGALFAVVLVPVA